MAHVIVSYDGSRDDRDALALGQLFASAGAGLSLAYVRHAPEADTQADATAQAEAEELLAAAAEQLNGADVQQYVVLNASTADGLAALAGQVGADIIAFGSSYRTPPGRIALPHTAEQLIDDEVPCSIAVAPAGAYDARASIAALRVYDEDDDEEVQRTASSLASALGASIAEQEGGLLLIASRSDTPVGRLGISATAREQAEQADSPVLLLARGAQLSFG
ncbi:MAG TPA: universal stress protein [Solirubrobacteraceae bacterium]|nr:universal stress protein [Solirubrobacteraceae bacterium]